MQLHYLLVVVVVSDVSDHNAAILAVINYTTITYRVGQKNAPLYSPVYSAAVFVYIYK